MTVGSAYQLNSDPGTSIAASVEMLFFKISCHINAPNHFLNASLVDRNFFLLLSSPGGFCLIDLHAVREKAALSFCAQLFQERETIFGCIPTYKLTRFCYFGYS